jgi:hypothetical protein
VRRIRLISNSVTILCIGDGNVKLCTRIKDYTYANAIEKCLYKGLSCCAIRGNIHIGRGLEIRDSLCATKEIPFWSALFLSVMIELTAERDRGPSSSFGKPQANGQNK